MGAEPVRIIVCGTGAASHVLATLISRHPDVELTVFTRSADKAREWADIQSRQQLALLRKEETGTEHEIVAAPFAVTSDPEQAARGCDMVVIALPAFVHAGYLAALAPYLESGCAIMGLPGECGFPFEVRHVLGDRMGEFTIVDFETLPWICSLQSLGKVARINGTKDSMIGTMVNAAPANRIPDPVATLERLLGGRPKLLISGHPLAITQVSLNSSLHPPIMYSQWHDWDGTPLDHAPLFYETMNELGAELLVKINEEILATTRQIAAAYPDIDLSAVVPKYDWYVKTYDKSIKDKTSLLTAIRTNSSYLGVKHPMNEVAPGRYVPNFQHRFLTEDVPFGLVVLRGISEIVGVPTPSMDLVLRWSQERMGREYLTEHGLTGADMANTRAPQRFGLTSVKDLVGEGGQGVVPLVPLPRSPATDPLPDAASPAT
jgi:ketopantoate reductase